MHFAQSQQNAELCWAGSRCLLKWCPVLKHGQSGWTVVISWGIIYAKMATILTAKGIDQCLYLDIPIVANSEMHCRDDVIISSMGKQLGGIVKVASSLNQTNLRTIYLNSACPDPHQRKKSPGPCVYKYSWQLRRPPTSSLWLIRLYFPTSSAYLLPADQKGHITVLPIHWRDFGCPP